MIRFLLDQGLPRRAAEELRKQGWHVRHVGDLGMQRSTDAEILEYADQQGMVIVTLDSDFARLLATARHARPSTIHIRMPQVTNAVLTGLLSSIVPKVQDDLEAGCIVSVDGAGARVHRLPIV